ncbi:MAG: hypothetical protein A2020_03505 [Lentisphaerae bacterium GWF2_45_14]|nr:MAG: hypothetical protein A2020_03505 [Lentisphaerae bacterium GWF2_45_14]
MLEDAEAVRKVLGGDLDSLEVLVERYKKLVFSVVGRRVSGADVPDIAHEVFLKAYRSLGSLTDPALFKSWLMTLAARTCCDYWRKSKAHMLLSIDASEYDGLIDERSSSGADDKELLDYVMERLTPEERTLIEMVYFEERSLKESAAVFAWGLAKTKVKAMRARHKMRKIIQTIEEDELRGVNP